MKNPHAMSRTQIMAECAMMVALAYVLSVVSSLIPSMPFGGSVTICATLPILIVSLRHRLKWGCLSAFVYSLLHLMMGMKNIIYVGAADGLARNAFFMVLCALLDYTFAYTALGLCGPIAYCFRKRLVGLTLGIILSSLIGFLCSVLSGILIWGSIARDGFLAVAIYSIVYNATWFFPNLAIVLIAAIPLCRVGKLNLMPEQPPVPG